MTNLLLLLSVLLAGDEQPFPCFEKNPWAGFAPGSAITRRVRVDRETADQTITVKAVEKDGILLQVEMGEKRDEAKPKFTPFSQLLGGGEKVVATGKSTKLVAIGARRIQATVREFTPSGSFLSANSIRVTFADEFPGGIVDVVVRGEDSKSGGTYTFKGLEKLKVDAQDVECFRFELKAGEGKKKLEGTYWLSPRVPGLTVKSLFKETVDKEVRDVYTEVLRYEVQK